MINKNLIENLSNLYLKTKNNFLAIFLINKKRRHNGDIKKNINLLRSK